MKDSSKVVVTNVVGSARSHSDRGGVLRWLVIASIPKDGKIKKRNAVVLVCTGSWPRAATKPEITTRSFNNDSYEHDFHLALRGDAVHARCVPGRQRPDAKTQPLLSGGTRNSGLSLELNRRTNMHFATTSNPSNPAARSQSALDQLAMFRQTIVTKLNEYKTGLLEECSNESEAFFHFARLAVNEAESLAWSTPYAHLFLPTLAEEKIQYARQWASRQGRVGSGLAAVSTTSQEVIR